MIIAILWMFVIVFVIPIYSVINGFSKPVDKDELRRRKEEEDKYDNEYGVIDYTKK